MFENQRLSLGFKSVTVCFFQSKLFEGLEDESGLSPDTFVPRKSVKKLTIKSKTVVEVNLRRPSIKGAVQLTPLFFVVYIWGHELNCSK